MQCVCLHLYVSLDSISWRISDLLSLVCNLTKQTCLTSKLWAYHTQTQKYTQSSSAAPVILTSHPMFFHFSLPKLGSGPPVASGVTVQMLISAPERWRHQTDLISNTFVAKPWFRYVSRFRTNSKLPDCGFKNKVAGHVTNYAQPSWKISHLFGEEAHL